MPREPLPLGYKTVVALTATASLLCFLSTCFVAVDRQPRTNDVDEAAGLIAFAGFLGILLLACAVGLAFRLRVARWLLLLLDLMLGLPWAALLTIAGVSMTISQEGYDIRRWQAAVLASAGSAGLAACLFAGWYLTFGAGRRVFGTPSRSAGP